MKPEFTRKLLKWNRQSNRREMPWKGEPDPYRIWLSEIILQQTRVEQGWGYYERFIKAFPSIHHLAKVTDSQVFKMWEGLGYYSRCKNLIATARLISRDYKGRFPSTYEEILRLKGVGPYTAAAIASFAFGESRAVVDGNVQRVLARYFGITTPIDGTAGKKLFAELAQALIDKKAPAAYNQAIMDFGAVICRPKNPLCDGCIQSPDCVAFQTGSMDRLPVKEKTLKKSRRWFHYYILQKGNSIYIRKREDRDIWQNLYEFVLQETDEDATVGDPENIPAAFLNGLFQKGGYAIRYTSRVYVQQLTHQRIHARFYLVECLSTPTLPADYRLVGQKRMGSYAFPKLINSCLEEHGGLPGT